MRKRPRARSLRRRLLTISAFFIALFSIMLTMIFHTAIFRILSQAEDRYLEEMIRVVEGGLEDVAHNIGAVANDVADWDETAGFVKGENPDFVRNNWLKDSFLETCQLHFIVINDANANVCYAQFYDYRSGNSLPVLEGFIEFLSGESRLVLEMAAASPGGMGDREQRGRSGSLFYQDAPYYAATMPILSKQDSGLPVGTVTIGNLLSNEFFQDMTHVSNVSFEMRQLQAPEIAVAYGKQSMWASKQIADINGDPATLFVESDREAYHNGIAIAAWAFLLLTGTVLVFVALLHFVVQKRVLRPIESLSRDVAQVGAERALDPGNYSDAPEIAVLCEAIKRMGEACKSSEFSLDTLRGILDGMDAIVYVTDPETDQIIFLNRKMEQHYGFTESVLGKPCWEVLQLGQEGRCADCPVDQLLQEPDKQLRREYLSPVTGRYEQQTSGMIPWGKRKMVHLQHMVDINDQKLSEMELKKQIAQQALMAAISQSFISTDPAKDLIQRALEMVGEFMQVSRIVIAQKASGDVLSRRFEWRNQEHEIGEPGAPDMIALAPGEVIYDSFLSGKRAYFACDHAESDAKRAYFVDPAAQSFIAVPLATGGEFLGILVVSDCTAPRKWEETDIHLVKMVAGVISELIAREKTETELLRMISIVDCSPLCIAYIAEGGALEYVNQGALDISGYTREELASGGLYMLFDPETEALIRGGIKQSAVTGDRQSFELPLTRKDGEKRDLLISAFAMANDRHGLGVIASDVTDKRRLEKDLLLAKEQAENSSRAKGDFLSRMSHEMRTPMNAIIGMTAIAKSTHELERKDYCLNKIQGASNHLLGVINDILDMSKIESGKFELSPEDFHLERMLMRVANIIHFQVENKKQNFFVEMDENVPLAIVADEQRLSQVLANLLGNAVKFTPEQGSVTLFVRCLDEDPHGMCTLQMEVRDTGIGVSREQQDRLFRSFEQADGGISRRFGGTGLGLAISKNIVEMMSGKIWVESEEGQGSRFLFNVKVERGSCSAAMLPAGVNWKNLRILAVDDSAEVREQFIHIGDRMGVRFDIAPDGYEACRMIEETDYDVVFVNWKMPRMDGMELARRIKQVRGDDTVVVMISSAEFAPIQAEARIAGVDSFVQKPLFASTVVDCINEQLGAQPAPLDSGMDLKGIFKGKRILLAEDMEINREILITLLEPTGIAVDCAENGREALRMFASAPCTYDMIFMDIHMPEVDGYESTRMIRALDTPRAKTIPIIAMTANVFLEDIERCFAAGMDGHVGKPIDMAEVVEKLRRYLFKNKRR